MSTDKRTQKWYNENAKNYTAHVRNKDDSIYHSLYEKPAMYKLLPNLNGKSVISIGCGSGEDCNYLQMHGAKNVTGIDLSENLIKIASQSYPNCDFIKMDMEHLDFADNSFEFAYSSLAIHYVEDWHQVFKEVYRTIKPGSYFLFSCEHPIASAMVTIQNDENVKISQISKIRNKRANTVEIVGDYLTRQTSNINSDWAVTTWHKPIGEIATEVADEGFLIANIYEPKPLDEMEQISPTAYQTLTKIPHFIIFKLYKPPAKIPSKP
jgi:ubiquinone/menaquinone biosynthesis C-methylase UbiE